MKNPIEYCPDDSLCATCGNPLPENPQEGTWWFEGFCGIDCAVNYSGTLRIDRQPLIIQLAKRDTNLGGPGFEGYAVSGWISQTLTFTLKRESGEIDAKNRGCKYPYQYADCWAWRIYDAGKGECIDFRMTHKAAQQ